MKGLAFAYDPDGYWVEVSRISRPLFGRFLKSLLTICFLTQIIPRGGVDFGDVKKG